MAFAALGCATWQRNQDYRSAMAILRNDTASVLGFVLLIAIIFVLANLIVDLMYAYLDPRVRLE